MRISENYTEIDFVLIEKEHRKFMQIVKALPVVFQHAVVVADIDKKKLRNVKRRTCTKRRKIILLKDLLIGKRLEKKYSI